MKRDKNLHQGKFMKKEKRKKELVQNEEDPSSAGNN